MQQPPFPPPFYLLIYKKTKQFTFTSSRLMLLCKCDESHHYTTLHRQQKCCKFDTFYTGGGGRAGFTKYINPIQYIQYRTGSVCSDYQRLVCQRINDPLGTADCNWTKDQYSALIYQHYFSFVKKVFDKPKKQFFLCFFFLQTSVLRGNLTFQQRLQLDQIVTLTLLDTLQPLAGSGLRLWLVREISNINPNTNSVRILGCHCQLAVQGMQGKQPGGRDGGLGIIGMDHILEAATHYKPTVNFKTFCCWKS